MPTNTAEPIFYIKQLFRLQINVILNQAIIIITKVAYLVLFFTYTWICKSCSHEDILVFILSSNLEWSFVQFV